jgi:hypothetical protein
MSKVTTKPLTERQIQIQCVGWFRQRYPEASRVFFAVPNGSARNAWTAKNLKDEGVLSGVADLILLLPRHGYAALCIEMKKIGGRQSDSQKVFEQACKEYKVKYVVCYSLEEFQAVVEEYLEK